MTLKTPEQIAREVYAPYRRRPDSQIVANIRLIIEAAIEADRAQRSYVVTIQEEGYDPHRLTVTPGPRRVHCGRRHPRRVCSQ